MVLKYVDQPLVSICLAVYNGEQTLLKCLNCLVNQSYENLEICISANVSVDKSVDIIKEFKKNQLKINITYQKKYVSYERNMYDAIGMASGEYFCFLGHDDFLKKDYVKNCIEKIADGKNNVLCQSLIEYTGAIKSRIDFKEFRENKSNNNFLVLLTKKRSEFRDKKYNLFLQGLIKKEIFDELNNQLNYKILYFQERCIVFLIALYGNTVISENYDYIKTLTKTNFYKKYPKEPVRKITLSSYKFFKTLFGIRNISLIKN